MVLNWYGCPWFVYHHIKKRNELKLHITCYKISCLYVTACFIVFTSFPKYPFIHHAVMNTADINLVSLVPQYTKHAKQRLAHSEPKFPFYVSYCGTLLIVH